MRLTDGDGHSIEERRALSKTLIPETRQTARGSTTW